ncbi:MAG TPA: ABC transporter permease [Blastocatellia bacterium]|nr:ABC transporter permease [Blastocatellia bacterium]
MRFPFWRKKREEDLDEEINQHLHLAVRERIERGESAEQANAAARREMGNVGLVKEVTRQAWGLMWLERLSQDIGYGLRILRKSPAFTAVAVLSLALGIGANTAIFSVANEVLLKSLPVRSPEQLVLLSWTSGQRLMGSGFWPGVSVNKDTGAHASRSFSYLTYQQFRSQSKSLSDVFAFTSLFKLDGVDDDTESPSIQMVSGNYYSALGVRAVAGRLLSDEDDLDTSAPVIVISSRYWQREFGRNPAAIGKTVKLDATPFTIIGVVEGRFSGTLDIGSSPDMAIPLSMSNRIGHIGPKFTDTMKQEPWLWPLMVMGRLKPSSTFDDVKTDLQGTFYSTSLEGWTLNSDKGSGKFRNNTPDAPQLQVSAGNQGLTESREELASLVRIMLAIVGIILLIVCSNLANLMLARSFVRSREIAVRMAMGARRGRLIRQLLTESLMLAVAGAVLGALFAVWGNGLFLAWINRMNPSIVIEPQIDLRVLGFTAAVSLITGLLVGIVPAIRATTIDLNAAMKSQSGFGRSRSVVSKTLLIMQIAMSVVLLTGAGLFVRTLINLQRTEIGFDTRNLLLFKVSTRMNREQRKQIPEIFQQVCDQIQAVPGVTAVTNSQWPLLTRDLPMPYIWVRNHVREAGENPTMFEQNVWPNFFDTMGMQIVLGRGLSMKDSQDWISGGPYHAVINETLARKYFQNVNPIGQRFGMTKNPVTESMPDSELIEVVGIVRDSKFTSVREAVPPTAFYPFQPSEVTFEVRTAVDPLSLASIIREKVTEVNPNLIPTEFRSQSDQAELTYATERHFAVLSSLFGLLAVMLVFIGLFGLLSYSVANRTQEFGIRTALGAQAREIISMVLRETLWLVSIGIAIGLVNAFILNRLIESMLYGVSRNDPVTIAIGVLLMIVVAVLAGFIPALRASKIDPMIALRYE